MNTKTILCAFALAAVSSAVASNADRVRRNFRLAKDVMPKWLCLEEVVGEMHARYLNAR